MNTNSTVVAKYGYKADGSIKKTPGRSANPNTNQTRTFYVVPQGGNYVMSSKGRPSIDILSARRKITIPKAETYSQSVHGIGDVDPADAGKIAQLRAKVTAKKATMTAGPIDQSNSGVTVEELQPV